MVVASVCAPLSPGVEMTGGGKMPDEAWLLFGTGDGSICDASPVDEGKHWVRYVRADLAIPAELAALNAAVDKHTEARGSSDILATMRGMYAALHQYRMARAKEGKTNG